MELTEQERQFLQTRTRFVRTWRYVGLVLLIGLGGFAGALISLVPWLANPFAVSTLLERGSVPPSTLILSAALLPVAVLTCLLLALTIVLLTFVAFSNEQKYLAILRRCAEASAAAPERYPSAGSGTTGQHGSRTSRESVD